MSHQVKQQREIHKQTVLNPERLSSPKVMYVNLTTGTYIHLLVCLFASKFVYLTDVTSDIIRIGNALGICLFTVLSVVLTAL